MKFLFLSLTLINLFAFTAHAQTVTGPGLENDVPPTAGVDRQEDTLGEPQAMNTEDNSEDVTNKKVKKNPMTEVGPKGKQAQEEAQTQKFDMTKKEIKKKQEGQ